MSNPKQNKDASTNHFIDSFGTLVYLHLVFAYMEETRMEESMPIKRMFYIVYNIPSSKGLCFFPKHWSFCFLQL
jgi:hypothetical protein